MNDTLRRSGFLRTSRAFPEDIHQLSVEVNRAYLDIAKNVNDRVIGFFPKNRSIETGERWFLTQAREQGGYRQVFTWDDTNLTIDHGINFLSLTNFIKIYGTFFDGTDWRPLPYVDVVAANNQIGVRVTPTQIIITKGAGAPPACQNGVVVVEFIANP